MAGIQSHPSYDNWIKASLSKALPTWARPGFPHDQFLLSGSLHKPLSLLHQRADRRSKRTTTPLWLEQKSHNRKLTKMKKQKVLSQMKQQYKIIEKATKWSRDRQPSRKRIQNNDSEDDPGSLENNGEDVADVYQRPRRNKIQQTDRQYTGRNQ